MAIDTGGWRPGFLLPKTEKRDQLFSASSSGRVSSSDRGNLDPCRNGREIRSSTGRRGSGLETTGLRASE